MSEPVFPGGCFFSAMVVEFDSRPGRVRDAVAAAERDLRDYFESNISRAIERAELRPDTDARQLAFELQALARAAGANALLFDDTGEFGLARKGMRHRLQAAATSASALASAAVSR
jgi:hypothetical protein